MLHLPKTGFHSTRVHCNFQENILFTMQQPADSLNIYPHSVYYKHELECLPQKQALNVNRLTRRQSSTDQWSFTFDNMRWGKTLHCNNCTFRSTINKCQEMHYTLYSTLNEVLGSVCWIVTWCSHPFHRVLNFLFINWKTRYLQHLFVAWCWIFSYMYIIQINTSYGYPQNNYSSCHPRERALTNLAEHFGHFTVKQYWFPPASKNTTVSLLGHTYVIRPCPFPLAEFFDYCCISLFDRPYGRIISKHRFTYDHQDYATSRLFSTRWLTAWEYQVL